MSRCANCSSSDADPDWGLCFECFCAASDSEQQERERYPEPTDAELCANYGHVEYLGSGTCYCGELKFTKPTGERS